jgi:hypothetical protein
MRLHFDLILGWERQSDRLVEPECQKRPRPRRAGGRVGLPRRVLRTVSCDAGCDLGAAGPAVTSLGERGGWKDENGTAGVMKDGVRNAA